MPTRRGKRETQRPGLLVLQVDTEKIEWQGLDLTEVAGWAANLSFLVSLSRPLVAKTTTFSHFQKTVKDAAAQGRWDVVVIIGHSDATGLRIGRDRFLSWEDVGQELKPLKPRRMVLIACKGGRSNGANQLFRKLRDLRRIYASPVNVSKDLGALFLTLVPAVVEKKAPHRDQIRFAQIWAGLSVGGQLRHWMRDHDKDNPHGELYDLLADYIDPTVRGLPNWLSSLLK